MRLQYISSCFTTYMPTNEQGDMAVLTYHYPLNIIPLLKLAKQFICMAVHRSAIELYVFYIYWVIVILGGSYFSNKRTTTLSW